MINQVPGVTRLLFFVVFCDYTEFVVDPVLQYMLVTMLMVVSVTDCEQ